MRLVQASPRLRAGLATTLAIAAAGCGAPPPPPRDVAPLLPAPPAIEPHTPESVPARWFDRRGKDLWGPTIGRSTLVLLGGRRALVDAGGIHFETAQAPDLLLDLAVVPIAGGKLRVVGVGERGVYRFDGPLGPAVAIARGTNARKIGGVDAYPGVAAVWTYHGSETNFIDVETGRWAPVPSGLPAAMPLGFVFRNEREGVALLAGVGLAATTDGGATFRLVRETGEGDGARVQRIRFRDGDIEARDIDKRPAVVDVAAATLGPFRGGTRVLEDDPPLRVPPRRGDELPLELWMRASDQNPYALVVDEGNQESPGRVRVAADGVVALLDLGRGRVADVAIGDKTWGAEVTLRASPGDHPMSSLSGGRQATVQGIWEDGGDPHVEVSQRSGTVKHPSIRFPGPHGKLAIVSPIEEDKDHALHFVLGDETSAYVVIQRSAASPAAAVPIPGARYALLHGKHGLAVGPGHVLVSSDGGATWSDVPPPRGLDEEVARLATSPPSEMAVGAAGARVGNLVRVGWGPAEPSPPDGPPPSVVAVPEGDPEDSAPSLICTTPGPAKGEPQKGQPVQTVLKAAVADTLERLGAAAEVAVGSPRPGLFTSIIAFAHDDAAHVWAAAWLDGFELGAAPRTWSAPAPPWATEQASVSTFWSVGGKALLSIASGDRRVLVRVEQDGAYETAEVPASFTVQGQLGVGAARRGPFAWIADSDLVLWRWGEVPRTVHHLAGASSSLSVEELTPAGVVIRSADAGFGVYRILPYPAPGGMIPPLGLDGWVRFDAAAEHPDRLPACANKPFDATVNLTGRPLHARIDGKDRSIPDDAVYRLRLTGKDACVAAVWTHFPEGNASFALRADLVQGKADGGLGEPQRLVCTWRR